MADSKLDKVTAVSFDKLSRRDRELLQKARSMVQRAYAPYSRFGVGAAVRTTSGAIYSGANMENAAYAVTLCAETSALQQSLAAGDFKIESIAVIGGPLDGTGGREIVTPCGRCRQLIFEASQLSGKDVQRALVQRGHE